MPASVPTPSFQLLSHPYRVLEPLTGGLRQMGRWRPGMCLVWRPRPERLKAELELAHRRPGGLPLIVLLPDSTAVRDDPRIVEVVERCRPQSLLPGSLEPRPDELAEALRRPPHDLPMAVTDYLSWRGLKLDRETRRIVQRIVDLSADLRSVAGISRGLYLSRRALGRRFLDRGIPVPSHWLQFARLLRVTIRLQNSPEALFSVGCELGYADGFALSNQMNRLVGVRPSDARRFRGWEWFLESWLRHEANTGGFGPEHAYVVLRPSPQAPPEPPSIKVRVLRRSGRRLPHTA